MSDNKVWPLKFINIIKKNVSKRRKKYTNKHKIIAMHAKINLFKQFSSVSSSFSTYTSTKNRKKSAFVHISAFKIS